MKMIHVASLNSWSGSLHIQLWTLFSLQCETILTTLSLIMQNVTFLEHHDFQI